MTEFDVRPWLVSSSDMELFEEDAEFAADQLNAMLHQAALEFEQLEGWAESEVDQFFLELSEVWIREPGLIEADQSELEDYVTHLIVRINQEKHEQQDNQD